MIHSEATYDRLILGVDPGTTVMGYGLLGVRRKQTYMLAMGVIKLNKLESHYQRLHRIYQRLSGVIAEFQPTELAIEAPFFGKNVQSMLKLGRAQGVAMVVAMNYGMSITEYEPRKVKQAITGNGAAAKEQVAVMLQRTLNISKEQMPQFLDATDALAVALCHYYESTKPFVGTGKHGWKDFIARHPDRVK